MKQFVFVSILATALSFLSGCGQNPRHSLQSVFGTDNRRGVADWIPIGRLGGGTAFAVGPKTIMTCAHCVRDLSFPATFEMHGDKGSFRVSYIVAQGAEIPTGFISMDQIANDWAILHVTQTLPNYFRISANAADNDSAQLAGYSGDLSGATIDNACLIREVLGSLLFDDCAMNPGASGGPIFAYRKEATGTDYFVMGVQSSHTCPAGKNCSRTSWSRDTANLGAKITTKMVATVIEENRKP